MLLLALGGCYLKHFRSSREHLSQNKSKRCHRKSSINAIRMRVEGWQWGERDWRYLYYACQPEWILSQFFFPAKWCCSVERKFTKLCPKRVSMTTRFTTNDVERFKENAFRQGRGALENLAFFWSQNVVGKFYLNMDDYGWNKLNSFQQHVLQTLQWWYWTL